MLDLASSRWAPQHHNVILTGKTGVGKSYLACTLTQKACRDGYTVAYRRFSRLLDELARAERTTQMAWCATVLAKPWWSQPTPDIGELNYASFQ